MTETSSGTAQTDKAAESEGNIFDQNEGVDWLVAWLVELADNNVEIGVTVAAGGAVITGTIVSGRRYFEELGKRMSEANIADESAELRNVLVSSFSQWGEIYKPENLAPIGKSKPRYIHLLNAQIVMGNQLSGSGFTWRLKLAAIDGICIGNMTASRG